ncbi:TolC family protein [Sandarakinorhabdus sp. AAP62]|uniref:TolC family protein n=1 Tax=Sandarakinorhabdus sp. AAP62 TaxID=1248916 RepID=UPI0003136C60|nr:TolC family protein [Sandarakinorhabdus sp. AAP62]
MPRASKALLALLLLLPSLAAAQQPASSRRALEADARAAAQPLPAATSPLSLEEVLAASRYHAPQVLEALARVRGAEGRLLTTEGAFDTLFSANLEARPIGTVDGSEAGVRLYQPLASNGGNVYAGYDVSRGRFSSSQAGNNTARLGRFTVGTLFSLLRDRDIDERRFNRAIASADVVLADNDRLLVAIGVQARTIAAWNSWVIAGQRVAVFKDLLQLALDRQAGFKRQVAEGLRPAILLTENEQNILRRQTLVVQAEQALEQAAITLSLFWRDADGNPIVPGADRLPRTLPAPLPASDDMLTALENRPDLRVVDVRIAQARTRLALDRNNFLPRLDLAAEVNQFVGDVGLGGRDYVGNQAKLGVTLTVPIQQRTARGRLSQTQAEIEAFQQRRRFIEDQIRAEIGGLSVASRQARRLLGIAIDEQDRALTMASAERRRFQEGASDFFLVNLREEAAADAQVRRLDAAFRQIVAQADLAAATADVKALGLVGN